MQLSPLKWKVLKHKILCKETKGKTKLQYLLVCLLLLLFLVINAGLLQMPWVKKILMSALDMTTFTQRQSEVCFRMAHCFRMATCFRTARNTRNLLYYRLNYPCSSGIFRHHDFGGSHDFLFLFGLCLIFGSWAVGAGDCFEICGIEDVLHVWVVEIAVR